MGMFDDSGATGGTSNADLAVVLLQEAMSAQHSTRASLTAAMRVKLPPVLHDYIDGIIKGCETDILLVRDIAADQYVVTVKRLEFIARRRRADSGQSEWRSQVQQAGW